MEQDVIFDMVSCLLLSLLHFFVAFHYFFSSFVPDKINTNFSLLYCIL